MEALDTVLISEASPDPPVVVALDNAVILRSPADQNELESLVHVVEDLEECGSDQHELEGLATS
jgi:hypothetical protein